MRVRGTLAAVLVAAMTVVGFAGPAKAVGETPPVFVVQPTGTSAMVGMPVPLTAQAVGVPEPVITWEQQGTGDTWTSVGDPGSGFATFFASTTTPGTFTFRAIATNGAGSAVSQPATVTVMPMPGTGCPPVCIDPSTPPSFYTQPNDVEAIVGDSVSFTAAASGIPTPLIGWETSADDGESWQPVAGGGNGQLTLPDVKLQQNGLRLRAIASNSKGTVRSPSATLTVREPAALASQPQSVSVAAGKSATFSVTTVGEIEFLQWKVCAGDECRDFVDDEDGTLAEDELSITVPATKDRNGLAYRVYWGGVGGEGISDAATLTVTDAPKPVPAKFAVTPKPKISGSAKVGKKLIVKAGAWKPGQVTLKFQWLRNGTPIKKATKAVYKVTKKDAGKRISVRVTASKPGYVTAVKTSSAKKVSRIRR